MVLVVLLVIWAAFLLPPLVRSRLAGNPVESIGRFNRHLRVLRSTAPAASALAGSAHGEPMPYIWISEARRLSLRRRRRQIAKGLLATAGATLVAGLLPGLSSILVIHAIVDVVLVSYLVMLAQVRRQHAERRVNAEFDLVRADAFGEGGTREVSHAAL